MNRALWMTALVALLAGGQAAHAQSSLSQTWVLDGSTLSYHMTHPVHEVEGTTHAAKGKGVCQSGVCDFLIAAPVKTFDSGDTNRDLHMLQVVRGAQFPVVTVRLRLPEAAASLPAFKADIDVTFAGQTVHYSQVLFTQSVNGQEHHISGVVPSTVSDFKIDPPRFLTVPIRNEIPVKVETDWHLQ